MPTKTDRILSYLPGTFQRSGQRSALHAVVDAFGRELLAAENSLAAVMQAHWVDHADRGSDVINDLARIAALYGLTPRCTDPQGGEECQLPPHCDETVEEFREHLKRYVRTFLEGTVTVQGILRVTAEALGLHIADDYEMIDAWWDRAEDEVVKVVPRGDDAAVRLLGRNAIVATGQAASTAQLRGTRDLSGVVDLSVNHWLRLVVDDGEPVDINLSEGAEDDSKISLNWLVVKINDTFASPGEIARAEDGHLILSSPTEGQGSRIEVQAISRDAAPLILGADARTFRGSAATSASVVGSVTRLETINLSLDRYIRVVIDGMVRAEIDCAGDDPPQTTPAEIISAINSALGSEIAEFNGQNLVLTSPTTGFSSTIAFEAPAAQDATGRLFGPVELLYLGQDARPAQVTGQVDLSGGLDLSERSLVQISVDGAPGVLINCVGVDPANTAPGEIVTAINEAFDITVARFNGRTITLSSPAIGPAGEIIFETPAIGDATEQIFGIRPRWVTGVSATAARIVGEPDLTAVVPGKPDPTNLFGQYRLRLAIDGGPATELDLRRQVSDPKRVSLAELAQAINDAAGVEVADHDNHHLILTSPTTGSASRLEIQPLESVSRQRFTSRAVIIDEAAQAIFGFVGTEAGGLAATPARLVGTVDLSRGVDLRQNRFIRLSIDQRPAVDINCAGVRPRATLLAEIVVAINARFAGPVAFHNDKNLILASAEKGDQSRIAFEVPQAEDALERLGFTPVSVRGQDAGRITFTGTVDLSEGIDLPAEAKIRLNVGGGNEAEIALTESDPTHLSLTALQAKINLVLGAGIAGDDGRHLTISSSESGDASVIMFKLSQSGTDVTAGLFGIDPPRSYFGTAAAPAIVRGAMLDSDQVDLSVARFLRISLNGARPQDIDCTAAAADPAATTLAKVATAINQALEAEIATVEQTRLVLKTPRPGFSSRITLSTFSGGDARSLLFGDGVPEEVTGEASTPAVITGTALLDDAVDLSERSLIRLSVAGERPVDIDVAGVEPAATFPDEIIAAINAFFPGLAALTDDDRLTLTAPGLEAGSRLELLPLRYLELSEYLPELKALEPRIVGHGDDWFIINDGISEGAVQFSLTNKRGMDGPTLINMTTRQQIRLLSPVGPGETIRLWRDPQAGLRAEIEGRDGKVRPVSAGAILVGPIGAQAKVPFEQVWSLTRDDDAEVATLQLNNPISPSIIRLAALKPGPAGQDISVAVVESELADLPVEPVEPGSAEVSLVGQVKIDGERVMLLDQNGAAVAQLRAGSSVDLVAYDGAVVDVRGASHAGTPVLVIVRQMMRLFDVSLRFDPKDGPSIEELYRAVTIGEAPSSAGALTRKINAGAEQSRLVRAEVLAKDSVVSLPRGRSEWVYLECHGPRFNEVNFDQTTFAGGVCKERAIFNISRFNHAPPEEFETVFAATEPPIVAATEISATWANYRAGSFRVNLPADLPARFGGVFNQLRFGQGANAAEQYKNAVTEPVDDDNNIINLILAPGHRSVVRAEFRATVPLGFEPVVMPFRTPRSLTGGTDDEPARIYLTEDELAGFIELSARDSGSWGNEIAVSARPAGPAMYDICVVYQGTPFENAREVVRGKPVEPLVEKILEPGPVGILQAKAAGVRAEVTRDRAGR